MSIETEEGESTLIPVGPKPIETMLADYHQRQETGETTPFDIKVLKFHDLPEGATTPRVTRPDEKGRVATQVDFYNPSNVMEIGGQAVLAVRREPHETEVSIVEFFRRDEAGEWDLITNAPVLEGYQDPFDLGKIQGEHLFGAVKILEKNDQGRVTNYATEIFVMKQNLSELHPVALGPDKLKGIRLTELPDGRIGVFIRPQSPHGEKYGCGQVCYTEINNISELSNALRDIDNNLQMIENMFAAGEWGGVNDLHILKDGRIGIVGHVARMVDGKKDYYAAICVFDPKTRTHTDWEIIATADDLAQAGINIKPKKEDLGSVYYPSGSVRNGGFLDLYAGVGDTTSILDRRKDPFLKYENLENI